MGPTFWPSLHHYCITLFTLKEVKFRFSTTCTIVCFTHNNHRSLVIHNLFNLLFCVRFSLTLGQAVYLATRLKVLARHSSNVHQRHQTIFCLHFYSTWGIDRKEKKNFWRKNGGRKISNLEYIVPLLNLAYHISSIYYWI